MHRVSTRIRLILVTLSPVAMLLWGSNGLAQVQQSVEDNVRPVNRVCLTGQDCVGTLRGGSGVTPAIPRAATPAAANPATPEPAPVTTAPVTTTPITTATAPTAVPAGAPAAATAFDPAATYQMSCFACHGSGAAGAPKLGDKAAWTEKLEKGMDAVMSNVMNGLNVMPPKGMCMNCNEAELRAVVDYMISQ